MVSDTNFWVPWVREWGAAAAPIRKVKSGSNIVTKRIRTDDDLRQRCRGFVVVVCSRLASSFNEVAVRVPLMMPIRADEREHNAGVC